jgi:hypothetical protein
MLQTWKKMCNVYMLLIFQFSSVGSFVCVCDILLTSNDKTKQWSTSPRPLKFDLDPLKFSDSSPDGY